MFDNNKLLKSLVQFFEDKREDFTEPVSIKFSDEEQGDLGKTAQYDMDGKTITIFTNGRHPKDILRSVSHELIHHCQNCRGEFKTIKDIEEGYAQKNPHLREMEAEAYRDGNLLFRDFESFIKNEKDKDGLSFVLENLMKYSEQIING